MYLKPSEFGKLNSVTFGLFWLVWTNSVWGDVCLPQTTWKHIWKFFQIVLPCAISWEFLSIIHSANPELHFKRFFFNSKISNKKDHVWQHFQAPRRELKIPWGAGQFGQIHSWVLNRSSQLELKLRRKWRVLIVANLC